MSEEPEWKLKTLQLWKKQDKYLIQFCWFLSAGSRIRIMSKLDQIRNQTKKYLIG